MKTASFVRILIFLGLAFFLIEFLVGGGEHWVIQDYPIVWLVLTIVLFFALAIEVSIASLKSVLYKGLSPEAREKYDADELARKEKSYGWLKKFYAGMLNKKPLEEEHEIVLDHNYDGIKELDNDLPSWWLYGFYISVIFAVIYMVRYHIFDGPSQAEEFETEMAEAKAAIEEYKKNAPDLIDAESVTLLTDASELKKGEAIFTQNCVACHGANAQGGIGPNLTDEYWILGGGIKNVFHTISEGGRDGKGMVSWKSTFKPSEIQQVASYVLSLQGTTPENAKEPQGDLWEPQTASAE